MISMRGMGGRKENTKTGRGGDIHCLLIIGILSLTILRLQNLLNKMVLL